MATINKKGKLTPTKQKQLLSNLGKGMSLKGSIELCGITMERLNICLNDGEKGSKLSLLISQAQAKAEHDLCIKIMDNGNARDCLAMLTARFNHWDKKADINTNDKTMKAEALLARMGTVPEVKRN
tara:strand:- start:3 stop:380 length:378 start_codon:yes stop_codon:yes gene_type:complete